MPISDFSELLNQRVILSPFVSRDDYGVPTYGTPVASAARIGHSKQIMRGSDGSIITVKSQVWLGTVLKVTTQDKITMPDGSTPPIINVEEYWDENPGEAHHIKLMLG